MNMSKKDEALMNMAEAMIRSGQPDRAEKAVRSIEDAFARDHGLMCISSDIALVAARMGNGREARRLMKTAQRIAQSIDTSFVRDEALANVEAARIAAG
ncbi:hypothetical protein OG242_17740 [Streptomyces sp. NBC_00727]|uniref:hypothetical protein n=1 Tax=Streptomyces sp. NBC_00727 TaxID=2903675 RepID=UPI00386A02A1